MKNVFLFFNNLGGRNLICSIFFSFFVFSGNTQVECLVTGDESPINQGSRSGCSKFYFIDYEEVLSLPIMETKVFFHFKANPNGVNFTPGDPDLTVPQWEMDMANGQTFMHLVLLEMNRVGSKCLEETSSTIDDDLIDSGLRFTPAGGALNSSVRFYTGNQAIQNEPNALNIRIIPDDGGYVGGSTGFHSNSLTIRNAIKYGAVEKQWWAPTTFARVILHENFHTLNLHHSYYSQNPCHGVAFDCSAECNNNGCTQFPYNTEGLSCFGGSPLIMGAGSQYRLTTCELNQLWDDYFAVPKSHRSIGCGAPSVVHPLVYNTNSLILWDGIRLINQDVIIKSGTTVEITCTVEMGQNKKIIVERGGKLIVNGGKITGLCGNQWQGIIVEGNASGSQTLAGKVELKNGAIIENAKNGVSMNPVHLGWPQVQGYWGGLVEATDATFIDCDRGVEFMKYGINNFVDASYFNNCDFTDCNHGITSWSNNGVTVTDCNFTNVINAIGPYDSHMDISDNEFTNVNIGVDITSTTTLPYATSVTNNSILANAYGVYATAEANGNTLDIINNSIIGSAYGIKLDGVSHYTILNNDFIGQVYGTHLYSTNVGMNDLISLNSFSSNYISNLNNHSNCVKFDHNCYKFNDSDIEVNTGSIHPFQQVDEYTVSGNCFTKGGIPDITTFNSLPFNYYIKDYTADCKVPVTSGNYELKDDITLGGNTLECGSNLYGSDPINILFRPCNYPKTEVAALLMKAQLQQAITDLLANNTMNAQLKAYLIDRYKACIKKLERVIIIIIKDDEGNDRDARRMDAIAYAKAAEHFENQALGLGMLIEMNKYTEAIQYINEMPAISSEQQDFKFVQLINIDFRQNMMDYSLSPSNNATLLRIGNETSPLTGYARGLYYTITGNRITTNPIHTGGSPAPRSKSVWTKGLEIKSYPNPVQNNDYFVSFSGEVNANDIYNIQVFNVNGVLMDEIKVKGQNIVSIDISSYTNGVYFVQVQGNLNKFYNEKFVVLK